MWQYLIVCWLIIGVVCVAVMLWRDKRAGRSIISEPDPGGFFVFEFVVGYVFATITWPLYLYYRFVVTGC